MEVKKMEVETPMQFKMKTSDGKIYAVDKDIMMCSVYIKNLLEDQEEEQEVEFPISSKIMELVIEFCEYHVRGEGKKLDEECPIMAPLRSSNMYDVVPKWYADFITRVDLKKENFELATAADYLDIKTLLHLTSANVAANVMNRSTEEIRKTFGIENDFTEEEKQEFSKEHQWVKETVEETEGVKLVEDDE